MKTGIRGLSDKVLLIVTGEMGRTPRKNNGGGRDHYGELTPLLLAGGGLKMGQVIGHSDSHAARPLGTSYRPENLLATILHTLFDVGKLRIGTAVPRKSSAWQKPTSRSTTCSQCSLT